MAIEDSRLGLDSALAAGLRCLVIPGSFTRKSDFTRAAAVLAGAHEVAGAIVRLKHPAGLPARPS